MLKISEKRTAATTNNMIIEAIEITGNAKDEE